MMKKDLEKKKDSHMLYTSKAGFVQRNDDLGHTSYYEMMKKRQRKKR